VLAAPGIHLHNVDAAMLDQRSGLERMTAGWELEFLNVKSDG
jgi:hypothetical protein